MIVQVGQVWEVLGHLPDGRLVRTVCVFNEDRVIGRLIDLGDGSFRADYVNTIGKVECPVFGDYYSALLHLTEEAVTRYKTLH